MHPILALLASAAAQDAAIPDVNAQLLRPSVDSPVGLWTDGAGVSKGRYGRAGLVLGYTKDPLVFLQGGERTAIVSNVVGADVLVAINVDRLRFGLDLPVYLLAQSDVSAGGQDIGDPSFDLRVNALDPAVMPAGLAFAARGTLPFGANMVDLPLGARSATWEAAAIGELARGPARVALNLGYRGLPSAEEIGNVALDDVAFARIGGAWELTPALGLSGEVAGQTPIGAFGAKYGSPVEAMAGGWFRAGEVVLRAQGGAGVTRGIGSPAARALVAVAWEPPASRDADKDGIPDAKDECPDQAEDLDAFRDYDGCPDPDNDNDGILDIYDECPLIPEDYDGLDDEDGCFEKEKPAPKPSSVVVRVTDPEGNLIPSTHVRVTAGERVIDGAAEMREALFAGTYSVYAEALGFQPLEDVLHVPEDATRHEAYFLMRPAEPLGTVLLNVVGPGGSPVPSALWSLGREWPIQVKGGSGEALVPLGEREFVVRADGFPPAWVQATVTADQPALLQVTLGEPLLTVEGDVVRLPFTLTPGRPPQVAPESRRALGELAEWLLDHPGTLRVEAHTGLKGKTSDNQALSVQRADAVRGWLVEHGVPAAQVVATGHGETRPLVKAETADAEQANARIELRFEAAAVDMGAKAEEVRGVLDSAGPVDGSEGGDMLLESSKTP